MKHLDLSGIENAYNDNTMLKFLYESYTKGKKKEVLRYENERGEVIKMKE